MLTQVKIVNVFLHLQKKNEIWGGKKNSLRPGPAPTDFM